MNNIRLLYFLAESPETAGRRTIFHVLSEGDVSLLRYLMTLLLLPSESSAMMPGQPPFTAALMRLHRLPTLRRIFAQTSPTDAMWHDMLAEPLLIIMAGDPLPTWVLDLATDRPVAVLTQSTHVITQLQAFPKAVSGLLQGMEDLREAYRAIRGLSAAVSLNDRFDAATRMACCQLAEADLFNNRPRLEFIRPFPLPQPDEGRPATYLFNRLSNNVDEPSLIGSGLIDGAGSFPQFLDWAARACMVLALIEAGEDPPGHIEITKAELEGYHARLVDGGESNDQKFKLFMELGRRVNGGRFPEHSLFAIPTPRPDLVRGKVPTSVKLDPGHKEESRALIHAVSDHLEGRNRTAFGTKKDERAYQSARKTLLTEQRVISCQSAYLAGSVNSIPTQLQLLSGDLYNALFDLSATFSAESRKIPQIFHNVQSLLAAALPEGLTQAWDQGTSLVTLFTDLPFEWTSVRGWPLCLTRPVSRIPMGFTHWDTLTAAITIPATIDIDHPERVLVLDLIDTDDPIRQYSDDFTDISASLGQAYSYASPKTAEEFRQVLAAATPEVVVLDAHGRFDRVRDELTIRISGQWVPMPLLLPDSLAPPVWILSACHTSVIGAMEGCFVRRLLSRGAVCVIATLARVDAFTASMFVGRLLTDIYNPTVRGMYRSLEEPFFATQLTTALLYDPMLPLIRRMEKDAALKESVGEVMMGYLSWAGSADLPISEFRSQSSRVLSHLLEKNGLAEQQRALRNAGLVRPETLLFTLFGAPGKVRLTQSGDTTPRMASASDSGIGPRNVPVRV